MLGDACLLRVGPAPDAVALGLRLTGALPRRDGFPEVRVGMHTGTAARRGADWFGSTINIAARVAALAGTGSTRSPRRHDVRVPPLLTRWSPGSRWVLTASGYTIWRTRRDGC